MVQWEHHCSDLLLLCNCCHTIIVVYTLLFSSISDLKFKKVHSLSLIASSVKNQYHWLNLRTRRKKKEEEEKKIIVPIVKVPTRHISLRRWRDWRLVVSARRRLPDVTAVRRQQLPKSTSVDIRSSRRLIVFGQGRETACRNARDCGDTTVRE